jgi:heme-degrading monooxygenase HmoA
VIARVWRGRTTAADAQAYSRHFTEKVRPELDRIVGHRGALLLRSGKPGGGEVEFLVVTMWDSMDAVRAFAGPDPERAVVEPAARAVLAGYDETVRHYDVVSNALSAPRPRGRSRRGSGPSGPSRRSRR